MSPASKFQILIVDDEKVQLEMLKGFLVKQGYGVETSEDGQRALEKIKKGFFDLILSDYRMPGMDGLQLLKEVKRLNPEAAVVIMTAYGTIDTAVEAMKAGASDFLTKPLELDGVLIRIQKVEREIRLERENRELKEQLRERFKVDFIISASPRMEEALNLAKRVAGSPATVLILGESGTGKELIARAIHYASPRSDKPFIKVNCAALPENLLESELFGHEKGAFTGAVARRIGRFEQADRGTIFLDEIGDLSLPLQVKLLRILQEKEFERVGSSQTIEADVRVIAATNRDLEEAIQKGAFREDLYYRLNVVTITLPSLRERKEDIPPLTEHFLGKYSRENKKEVTSLSKQAKDLLMRYHYPGNVRELENIIERAVVLCRENTLTTQDLPLNLQESKAEIALERGREGRSLPQALEEIERQEIAGALQRSAWVQTKAAEELGISERVLRYKLKKYKITEKE
ncbi:MAG TPA: sigma-54 dependent transcriptional regulator [Thermodesulfobacteriota bacterium]|nr:sigma-54 dependent transcriptional regulator [Thermodesulfobacteriota bacterium]